MKAIAYIMPCPPQDLKIIDFRKPSPLKNELLVKVHAFGLNFAEICNYFIFNSTLNNGKIFHLS